MDDHWSNMNNELCLKHPYVKWWYFYVLISWIMVSGAYWIIIIDFTLTRLCAMKGLTLTEAMRRYRKGMLKSDRTVHVLPLRDRVTSREVVRRYLKACIVFSVLGASIMPTGDLRAVEIIEIPASPVEPPSTGVLGEPLRGVGRDARLEDVLKIILPSQWVSVFQHSELKAMRVNWFSETDTTADVLATLGRLYGFEVYYQASSKLLNVRWRTDVCYEAQLRNKAVRMQFRKLAGFPSEIPLNEETLRVNDGSRDFLC